jgi:hypothetical protein
MGFVGVVVGVLFCIRRAVLSSKVNIKREIAYDVEESVLNITPEIHLWGSEVFARNSVPDTGIRKKTHSA